jgi:hypothetical protein
MIEKSDFAMPFFLGTKWLSLATASILGQAPRIL